MAFLGGLLVLFGLIGILLGVVTLIKPIARFRIPTRRVAGVVAGGSFMAMVLGAMLAPGKDDELAPAASATEAPTKTVKATATPKPTNTPIPPAPTPAPLTFEDQVAKSYRDNRSFMPRAVGDPIKVTWLSTDGMLRIDVFPKDVMSNGDVLTIGGASAIVASRAVWATYPQVKQLQVSVFVDFTDSTGKTNSSLAVMSTVERRLGESFDYQGLKERATGDNKLWFCGANHYRFHPAIWSDLGNKGCLTTISK